MGKSRRPRSSTRSSRSGAKPRVRRATHLFGSGRRILKLPFPKLFRAPVVKASVAATNNNAIEIERDKVRPSPTTRLTTRFGEDEDETVQMTVFEVPSLRNARWPYGWQGVRSEAVDCLVFLTFHAKCAAPGGSGCAPWQLGHHFPIVRKESGRWELVDAQDPLFARRFNDLLLLGNLSQ